MLTFLVINSLIILYLLQTMKTTDFYRNFKHYILFFYILYLAILAGFSKAYAEKRANLLSAKKSLSAQLDSIEVEKQMRKRKGKSLADLEKISEKIRDSIAVLRAHFIDISESDSKYRKRFPGKTCFNFFIKSLKKPKNFFDWIIIIVGIIAVLSGTVLIAGLIHTFFFKNGRKSGRQQAPPVSQKPHQVQFSNEYSKMPSSVSSAYADIQNKDIDSLRKKMLNDIEHSKNAKNSISPFFSSNKADDNREEQKHRDTIRDSIIKDGKAGLDAQEISRKYHVSVDQVTLILRISNSGKSKNM